jgi:putative ABC transport system ATP-binding protein
VLKGVDFDAKHGDVTMVMGPSGSGKSTLVAALSGLLRPDEGKVEALEADDLWKLSPGKIDKFRLDHCGFIFQGFNLFPALTAKQQVMTVLKYQGVGPGEANVAPRRRWSRWAWARASTSVRPSCRAARSSASPSPAPWPRTPT